MSDQENRQSGLPCPSGRTSNYAAKSWTNLTSPSGFRMIRTDICRQKNRAVDQRFYRKRVSRLKPCATMIRGAADVDGHKSRQI